MQNKEAMKLPDPLLVRYYRAGRIEQIQKVTENKKTREIAVQLDAVSERWTWLKDIGWIPAE